MTDGPPDALTGIDGAPDLPSTRRPADADADRETLSRELSTVMNRHAHAMNWAEIVHMAILTAVGHADTHGVSRSITPASQVDTGDHRGVVDDDDLMMLLTHPKAATDYPTPLTITADRATAIYRDADPNGGGT